MANNKYTRRQKYISTDGGLTFNPVTPPEYIKGELIETDSVDCGAEAITWVPVEDVYICESLVPAQYRWVTVSGEYVCVDGDKCSKEKQQVSYDSGSTWTDTGETRAGSVLESHSSDCPIDVNIEGSDITTWLTTNGIPFTIGIDLGTCQHIVTDCYGNYNSETWYSVQHYEWMTTTDSTVYELSTYDSFHNTSNPCHDNNNRCIEYNYHLRYIVIPSEFNIKQLIYDRGQNYGFTPKGHFQILTKVSNSWTYNNIKNGWRRFNTTATHWCDGGTRDETIIPMIPKTVLNDCETLYNYFVENVERGDYLPAYWADRVTCYDPVETNRYFYRVAVVNERITSTITETDVLMLTTDKNVNVISAAINSNEYQLVYPGQVFYDQKIYMISVGIKKNKFSDYGADDLFFMIKSYDIANRQYDVKLINTTDISNSHMYNGLIFGDFTDESGIAVGGWNYRISPYEQWAASGMYCKGGFRINLNDKTITNVWVDDLEP